MAIKRENKKREKPEHLVARAKTKFTTYQVKEQCELLDFLMKAKEGISRNSAKSLLTNRMVYVNNTLTTLYNTPLKPGMLVQISKAKGQREFSNKYIKILYEDAYLLVIEKKEGLATIAGERNPKEMSAQSILTEYVKRSSKQNRVFVIHRMDKEASGLMIFAKDEKTKFTFQDHWDDVVKERRFVAVVWGEMAKDKGVVASWMKDGKLYMTEVVTTSNNDDRALTGYHTIKRANGLSMVELIPETGKKDQIRVHMQQLGHPVVGDEKYASDKESILPRLALHAFKLAFYHPITGMKMEYATPYPSDFKRIMLKQQTKE